MNRVLRAMAGPLSVCWLSLGACVCAASQAPTRDVAGGPDPISKWDAQLSALDPADADGYLRLGELLADEASDPDQIRLARRLLVYAVQIGRESEDPAQRVLGASAALALASEARGVSERRWLRAMAKELDPRLGRIGPRGADAPPDWDPSVGLAAAEALGLARSGGGRAAEERLEEPGVAQVLQRVTPLLGVVGGGGAVGVVERLAVGWPCPQCSGERVVRRRRDGEVATERCPTCLANPGAREMTLDAYKAHLRAELWLLGGSVRGWSAQLELDDGEPLREPTVSGLQRFYRVDPQARLWQGGQWVRPEETSGAPPQNQQQIQQPGEEPTDERAADDDP